MNLRQFFSELRRRHVYRIAVAYAVVAWLLIQIATQVFPFFEVPNWGVRLTILFIVIGFPVAVILAWAFEITPEGIKRAEDLGPDESRQRRIGRKFIAFVAVVTLLATGFALFQFTRRKAAGAPTSTSASKPVVADRAIAVLPFKALTAENRDAVLEMGMADTLIAKLSDTRAIVVRSLASVRKYVGVDQDPLAAGRELGVSSVLEGSVQQSGGYLRVTARLLSVADGASLWADTFNEQFTNVFDVQDVIAQKVASALALRLNQETQQLLTKRYTESTEAYQLYLKGRFYWNKYTEDGLRTSIEHFEGAIGKDPGYALAYAGLADTFSLMGEFGYGPPKESFERARSYAQKAITLDDSLGDAHLSLGIVKLLYDWDLAGAEKELGRAKELSPNSAQVYHFYGHYLELSGRMEEAIVETQRGLDLDPTNLVLNNELAFAYKLAGKYEAALAQYRRTLELDPSFAYSSLSIAMLRNDIGRYEEAVADLNNLRAQHGDDQTLLAELAYAQAKLGKTVEAKKILEQFEQRRTHEFVDAVFIASVYMGLDDTEQALTWLGKGYQEKSSGCPWLKFDRKFDPLRSDPRFTELMRRIGIN